MIGEVIQWRKERKKNVTKKKVKAAVAANVWKKNSHTEKQSSTNERYLCARACSDL